MTSNYWIYLSKFVVFVYLSTARFCQWDPPLNLRTFSISLQSSIPKHFFLKFAVSIFTLIHTATILNGWNTSEYLGYYTRLLFVRSTLVSPSNIRITHLNPTHFDLTTASELFFRSTIWLFIFRCWLSSSRLRPETSLWTLKPPVIQSELIEKSHRAKPSNPNVIRGRRKTTSTSKHFSSFQALVSKARSFLHPTG